MEYAAQGNGSDTATLIAEIAALKAKLAKANAPRKLTLKVSAQGGVSCYGFGKWPVTLYKDQWLRLVAHGQEIKDFIEANEGSLSTKD